MKTNKLAFLVIVVLIMSLALAACKPAPAPEPAPEEPVAEEPVVEEVVEEPAEEEAAVEEPVEEVNPLEGVTVQYWHVYGEGKPMEGMVALVDEFNKTNEYGITVEALDQGRHSDLEEKMNAAILSGDLPDVLMAYTNAFADWYAVDVIADMSSYIDDPDYGLSADEKDALYASAFDAGLMPDGARVAYPLTQSANVLVYNNTWAEEMGFVAPPATAAELKEQLCAGTAFNTDRGGDFAGTGGLVYYPSSTNYLTFLYAFGGNELNEAGDAYEFNSPEGVAAAMYLNDLRDSGCTFVVDGYPNPEQGQRKALVTSSSTAGMPYYAAAFEDANNEDVWSFIGAPGPDGTLAVDAFQQMIGVVNSTPEKTLASWVFIKWLTNAENQATWISDYSGYLPTQATSAALLESYAAENAVWATGAELAAMGPAEPQTFPAWSSVRRAIGDAAAQLFQATTEEEVIAILTQLTDDANALVAEVQ